MKNINTTNWFLDKSHLAGAKFTDLQISSSVLSEGLVNLPHLDIIMLHKKRYCVTWKTWYDINQIVFTHERRNKKGGKWMLRLKMNKIRLNERRNILMETFDSG